ncbi:Gustatory receptor 119a, partial [Halyomorpha halys]
MVRVEPCQPSIGKVDLVLKDVFWFSRLIGMFPIDNEYSAISKLNLAKGIILYLPIAVFAVLMFYRIALNEDELLAEKVTFVLQTLLPIIFCWTHLAWIIRNNYILKELYVGLKDIEYHLWKSNICWFYKPNWCTKYLSVTVMLVGDLLWDIFKNFQAPEYLAYYLLDAAVITIMSQYALLLQILLYLLRDIRAMEESDIIIKLTDKLLALCQKLNTLYELQLLLYIVLMYLFILFKSLDMILRRETITGGPLIFLMSLVLPVAQTVMNIGLFSQE